LLSHLLRDIPHGVLGTDISPPALALSRDNLEHVSAQQLLAGAPGNDVAFVQDDLFAPDFAQRMVAHPHAQAYAQARANGEGFDIITANPPYITRAEYATLPHSVRAFEDPGALLGVSDGEAGVSAEVNDQGLAFYVRIARLLPELLRPSADAAMVGAEESEAPRVMLEIGAEQGEAVRRILLHETRGVVSRAEVWEDQYGRARGVVGWTVR
jgi:methylase of polypeptide subunit release factors